MHILVINGSPKGSSSVTLQTIHYLEKCYPRHTFSCFHAGARIKALEKDFTPALEALQQADHKFYKSHGQYDFPQKQRGKMLAM